MSKNIVFDLEHTLIIGINLRVLHPEAKEVLAAANRDFDKTYLWTYCFSNKAISCLKDLDILSFFCGVIGVGIKDDQFYTNVTTYEGGKKTGHRTIPITLSKDLRKLGDPRESVLIEDQPSYGAPLDRIVEIVPYQGQQGHSLLEAYSLALKKF
jgi:hypothetical protein